jgi:hypothetical protein
MQAFCAMGTGKPLSGLSFQRKTVMIAGFPLPTLDLTPGWAIL